MQIKTLPAFALFLGSYFPLSIIFLVQDVEASSWKRPICRASVWFQGCELPKLANPARSLSLFAVCALSLIAFLILLKVARGNHVVEINDSKAVPNDLINYVFPYVVAFMVLDLGDTGKYFGFLVFLAWMFVITYSSGQILMNPLLLVAKWQLYEITGIIDGKQKTVRAISRSVPVKGKSFLYRRVQDIRIINKEVTSGETSSATVGTTKSL